jgi:hypothetical protein
MSGTNLFTQQTADAVKAMIPGWPDAIELADPRKGENYWAYFTRKRAGFDGTFAFGVEIPDQEETQYLAITFAEGGDVTSVEVMEQGPALKQAKIAMKANLKDWEAIVGGYDIGKAMTYHQLPLTKGGSLDLLRCVYFLHELIVILTRVEIASQATVSA